MLREIKTSNTESFSIQDRDLRIAKRLMAAVDGETLREVALTTGYNTETTRRYMKGESRLPADFIRQIAIHYTCDARYLLGVPIEPEKVNLKLVTTDKLVDELGRRMTMVENCAIASVVVNQDST